jgi:two-component system, LytTR family, sensor kinase
MTANSHRVVRRYAALFLAWTLIGLFMFSQGLIQKIVTNDPNPWWHHLTSWMVGVWTWFLFTPGVLWLGKRFPLERKSLTRRIAFHLLMSAVVSLVELIAEAAVLYGLHLFPSIMTSYIATLVFLCILGFHQGVMTYWGILGVQYAWGWYRRYEEGRQEALRLELRSSELEKQLVQAHLSALRAQLQPHFLFNTLNAIMVLVRQHKGREAEEMLAKLSDLLRSVLEDVETQEVPLSRELEYLQLYLSIEQVRFQDRLRVEIAVDPEMLDSAVPSMALQPIVENAIRHGIGRSLSAGSIVISATGVDGKLAIRIRDDGPGLGPADGVPTRGIGISNTRARLARLYGDGAQLLVENGENGGAVATMILPRHIAPPSSAPETMEPHASHSPVS